MIKSKVSGQILKQQYTTWVNTELCPSDKRLSLRKSTIYAKIVLSLDMNLLFCPDLNTDTWTYQVRVKSLWSSNTYDDIDLGQHWLSV